MILNFKTKLSLEAAKSGDYTAYQNAMKQYQQQRR